MIDLNELKARHSLADIMVSDGCTLRRVGPNHSCRCIFHEERTPSLVVYPEGRFKCYGCGASGDLIEYWQRTRGVSFREAVMQLGGTDYLRRQSIVITKAAPRQPELAAPLTEAQRGELVAMSRELAGDPDRCAQIALARGWKPETVAAVAQEGNLGVHGNTLAFIYAENAKLRWRAYGERRIKAHFTGHPYSLWRMDVIRSARRVLIAEGETDAISLLDLGVERDGATRAVAVPGADTFKDDWGPLFRRREAVLLFDDDKAGENGAEKAARVLRKYTRKVSVLNWRTIHACL